MKKGTARNSFLSFALTVLLALAVSSCVLPAPRPVENDQPRDVPFIAPSLAPTSQPTSAATPLLDTQQPVDCIDQLTFVSDVTVPDGTVVAPSSSIDKRWEVKNSGTCTWNSKYSLRLVAGEAMGTRSEQALAPTRSGSSSTIRLLFKAPKEPGTYRSAWQAYTPTGQPFGDTIYLEIVVQ